MDDQVGREDGLGEAGRQVNAHHGAPGRDKKTLEELVASGQEEGMLQKLQAALRAHRYQFAPVRVGEIPKPKGGTRPLGSATGEERGVQTAMKLILEPICEADFHACSSGYRPKRDAQQAALALREDLDNQAWGVGESDGKSSFPSIPHGKLRKRSTKRIAAGRRLKWSKQPLQGGSWDKGQVAPPQIGVPQGAPSSPLYSHLDLNLRDQLWHSRGDPTKRGATLHRYAEDALLGCRQSAKPVLAALEAIAQRRDLTLKRDKTRETRLSEGFDFRGGQFVKAKVPRVASPPVIASRPKPPTRRSVTS